MVRWWMLLANMLILGAVSAPSQQVFRQTADISAAVPPAAAAAAAKPGLCAHDWQMPVFDALDSPDKPWLSVLLDESQTHFHIMFGGKQPVLDAALFDVEGKLVRRFSQIRSGEKLFLPTLGPGSYFVELVSETGIIWQRLYITD